MEDSFLWTGVTGALGSSRWSFARLPAAHLLLCGPVPNRPRTSTALRPRGWGPLVYKLLWVHISFSSYNSSAWNSTAVLFCFAFFNEVSFPEHLEGISGSGYLLWRKDSRISSYKEVCKNVVLYFVKSPGFVVPTHPSNLPTYFHLCPTLDWIFSSLCFCCRFPVQFRICSQKFLVSVGLYQQVPLRSHSSGLPWWLSG